jgi:alkylation response protein AidB-like acyl-CoA dehydrogenase
MTSMEAFNRESALTKLFVTDTAMDVVRKAVAVHGSYGVMDEFKVERLYRDVVIGEQIEGANDLQRIMVCKGLLF